MTALDYRRRTTQVEQRGTRFNGSYRHLAAEPPDPPFWLVDTYTRTSVVGNISRSDCEQSANCKQHQPLYIYEWISWISHTNYRFLQALFPSTRLNHSLNHSTEVVQCAI